MHTRFSRTQLREIGRTRPHESRRRLRKALESLTFADIAILACVDRELESGKDYSGLDRLVSQGFISSNLKLRRYRVCVVRAIKSYMKKKGLNPLGYTNQEWQYVWGLTPIVLEREEPTLPKVIRQPKVLKLKVKTH